MLSLSHCSHFLWFQGVQLGPTVWAELMLLKSQDLIYYFSWKFFDPKIYQQTSVSLSCCASYKCNLYGMQWLNWKISLIPTSTAFPGIDLGHILKINALADGEEHKEWDQDRVRLHERRNTSCKIHYYAEESRISHGLIYQHFKAALLEMEPATAPQTRVCIPVVYCDLALVGLQRI